QIEAALADRAAKVPSHLRIQRFDIVDKIPRTTTLKVQRSVLRTRLQALAGAAEPDDDRTITELDEVSREVLQVVQGLVDPGARRVVVNASSSLVFDLGLDSMGLLELATRLRDRFDCAVSVNEIHASKTVGDLVPLVAQAPDTRAQSAEPDRRRAGKALQQTSVHPEIPSERSPLALAVLGGLGWLLRAIWDLRAEGAEALPTNGPFVLCPNHQSYLDGLSVTVCLPTQIQVALCTLAKRELFEGVATRMLTRFGKALSIGRGEDPRDALDAGLAVLAARRPLLVHPEGTRSFDGSLLPFRGGAARLSLETGAPLVPVLISGAYDIYPRHARLPRLWPFKDGRRLRLRIRFGSPIPLPGCGTGWDAEQRLTEQLRQAVVALGGEDQP
ncbi:MAG: 1-acyl-sn-glycerol-3-phosphate acyltransferase, partial [Pseudomonadota bacterium]